MCKTFAKDDADHKILTGVGNRVLKCDKDYLNSKAFRILNKSIHDKVSNDPKNLHYYLKEYLDEIECVRRNAQRAKPKVHTKSEANEHVKEENGFRSVGGTKDASSLNGVTTSCESSSVSLEEQNSSSKARHIMKLERLLEVCSRHIIDCLLQSLRRVINVWCRNAVRRYRSMKVKKCLWTIWIRKIVYILYSTATRRGQ